MTSEFDVIVVGGGPAGLSSAYFLAEKGFNVVVLERGVEIGNKNVYGGRIYSHILEKHIPGFVRDAPIERWIRKEKLTFMTENDAVSLEYQNNSKEDLGSNGFTAYLSHFSKWLSDKAEESGAVIATGVRVDDLIIKEGSIKGIRSGDEKLIGEYVLIAEGANRSLLEKSNINIKTETDEVAVGVKEVIRLSEETIKERFNLEDEDGTANLYVGYPLKGTIGGGFLYTMKNSVALGIVVRLSELVRTRIKSEDLIESFRLHPAVKKYVKGGTLMEYSAHLIWEAGLKPKGKIYGNGFLVLGDAAGFTLNTGLTVRGVDFALESGRIAAETIHMARDAGRNDGEYLASYYDALENSFILNDLRAFRKAPIFLSNLRLYSTYPELFCSLLDKIYKVDGEEPVKLFKKIRKEMKNKVSMITIIRDLINGLRSL